MRPPPIHQSIVPGDGRAKQLVGLTWEQQTFEYELGTANFHRSILTPCLIHRLHDHSNGAAGRVPYVDDGCIEVVKLPFYGDFQHGSNWIRYLHLHKG